MKAKSAILGRRSGEGQKTRLDPELEIAPGKKGRPLWRKTRRDKYDHATMTISLREVEVKKMAAGSFKANCLAVMDEVQAKHETVVITKHGKPVAKLVPVNKAPDEIYNFLAGKGAITGDVVAPALSPEDWGELK